MWIAVRIILMSDKMGSRFHCTSISGWTGKYGCGRSPIYKVCLVLNKQKVVAVNSGCVLVIGCQEYRRSIPGIWEKVCSFQSAILRHMLMCVS